MLELFDGQQHDIQTQIEENEVENSLSVHHADMAYWERKFSKLSAIPALPWKTPLQHLPTSRYQRNSLVIEKINLNSCLKLAQNIHCLKTQSSWRLFWKCYLIGILTNLYVLLFLHFPLCRTIFQ